MTRIIISIDPKYTFRNNGADKALLGIIKSAFRDGDELEIVWEKSGA